MTLMVVTAGCADDDTASVETYQQRLARICAEEQRLATSRVDPAREHPTVRDLERRLEISQERQREIRQLDVPSSLERDHRELYEAVEAQNRRFRTDVIDRVRRGSDVARAVERAAAADRRMIEREADAARRLGVLECVPAADAS